MNWIELWAKLEVISIIFGLVVTLIVGIIYIIMWIGGKSK